MSVTNTIVEFLPASSLNKLQAEYETLHLLYCRIHNQHRVAVWWRYLEMIHLNVRKILKKCLSLESAKKIRVKEKLCLEAKSVARYMVRKKVFTKAFYEFNGIIALGQFITLGLALLGATSKIYSILIEVPGVSEASQISKRSVKPETIIADADDDLGEEVEMPVAISPQPISEKLALNHTIPIMNTDSGFKRMSKKTKSIDESGEKRRRKRHDEMANIFGDNPDKNKHKKKKKKKSAMDDIFG